MDYGDDGLEFCKGVLAECGSQIDDSGMVYFADSDKGRLLLLSTGIGVEHCLLYFGVIDFLKLADADKAWFCSAWVKGRLDGISRAFELMFKQMDEFPTSGNKSAADYLDRCSSSSGGSALANIIRIEKA